MSVAKWGGDEYIAGIHYPNILDNFTENTYETFSEDERMRLGRGIGGGLLWMNLKKMREDGMEAKLLEYLEQNLHRLKQAEQDVFNLVLYPKIRHLPQRMMVCSYLYDILERNDFMGNEVKLSEDDKAWLEEACKNPIQLHYATHIKPWSNPACTKSEVWFKYLLKTPFFYELMKSIYETLPDEKYYLFKIVKALRIKKNKLKLFGLLPIYKKGK